MKMELGFPNLPQLEAMVCAEISRTIEAARDAMGVGGTFQQLVMYLEELRPIVEIITSEEMSAAGKEALKTLQTKLKKAQTTIRLMSGKSRIWMLLNCLENATKVQAITREIGLSLGFFTPMVLQSSNAASSIRALGREMRNVEILPARAEQRLLATLERHHEDIANVREMDVEQQDAILLEVGRVLGIESVTEVREQVAMLRMEVESARQRKQNTEVQYMLQILEVLQVCARVEAPSFMQSPYFGPDVPSDCSRGSFSDWSQPGEKRFGSGREINPPLGAFICPLTRQVMQRPVTIASTHTFEHEAIMRWFETEAKEGRGPTCPLTRQALPDATTTDNVSLRQAIEQWHEKNIDARITQFVEQLQLDQGSKGRKEVLGALQELIAEWPANKRRIIREDGMLQAITRCFNNSPESRLAALELLLSLATEDNLDDIGTEQTIRRLFRCMNNPNSPDARGAVEILRNLSTQPSLASRIGSAQGAFLMLVAFKEIHPPDTAAGASVMELLDNLEEVDSNIGYMLDAEWIDPLVKKLVKGPDTVRARMCAILAERRLSDESSARACEMGALPPLAGLLKVSPQQQQQQLPQDHRAAALSALNELSLLPENCKHILDSPADMPAVLPELAAIVVGRVKSLETLSVSVLSNIASCIDKTFKPPLPELVYASLGTEAHISSLLQIFKEYDFVVKDKVGKVLTGLLAVPGHGPNVARMIAKQGAIAQCMELLRNNSPSNNNNNNNNNIKDSRKTVFTLLHQITSLAPNDVVEQLRPRMASHIQALVEAVNKEQDSEDKACLISIMAELPPDAQALETLRSSHLLETLLTVASRAHGFGPQKLQESLAALVKWFTLSLEDPGVLKMMQSLSVVLFCRQVLESTVSTPRAKAYALESLVNMGRKSSMLSVRYVRRGKSFVKSLGQSLKKVLSKTTRRSSSGSDLGSGQLTACPLHKGKCSAVTTFCLAEDGAWTIRCMETLLQQHSATDRALLGAMLLCLELMVQESELAEECQDFIRGARVGNCLIPLLERATSDSSRLRVLTAMEKVLRMRAVGVSPPELDRIVRAVNRCRRGSNDQLQDLGISIWRHLDIIRDVTESINHQ